MAVQTKSSRYEECNEQGKNGTKLGNFPDLVSRHEISFMRNQSGQADNRIFEKSLVVDVSIDLMDKAVPWGWSPLK